MYPISVCGYRVAHCLHWNRLHTSQMSLSEDVDLEEFVMAKDGMSGADIKAVNN